MIEDEIREYLAAWARTETTETLHRMLEAAVGRIDELTRRRDELLTSNNEFEQAARDARASAKTVIQAITDPENQPSQWGTIPDDAAFQSKVAPWMEACFGPEISKDRVERNHRFLEEAVELVQAGGSGREEAHQIVDYVFDRPVGGVPPEVGGVMVTLAALCLAHGVEMHVEAEVELARIWTKVEAIRSKQQNKPKFGPLPGNVALVRHRTRGSSYRVVGQATLQASYGPPRDHAELVVYRCLEDGLLWARPREEFLDGRFEVLQSVSGVTHV